MTSKKKKVTLSVPHRISGFFEIVDEINGIKIDDPERIGSTGAGFNLSAIGKTEIKLTNSDIFQCKIQINEQELNERAETTNFICNYLKQIINKPVSLKIKHTFELPVGCGYGTSGSGALGTIYGFKKILDLNIEPLEMGRIAHIAEVINRTGLGTVCGQLQGGLCLLKEPGYPCTSKKIDFPEGLRVICGTFGMIHTKSILSDPVLSSRIKEAGRKALATLNNCPNIKTFMEASITFVKETNLLDLLELSKTKDLMNNLNKLNLIGASMNQLGRSVYAVCYEKDVDRVFEEFNTFKPDIQVYNLMINKDGPIIIKR